MWDIEYPVVISPCYWQNSQLQTMWCLKIWCPILPIQLKCGFSFYLGLLVWLKILWCHFVLQINGNWKDVYWNKMCTGTFDFIFTNWLGKNLIVYVVVHLNPCYYLYMFICWYRDVIMLLISFLVKFQDYIKSSGEILHWLCSDLVDYWWWDWYWSWTWS